MIRVINLTTLGLELAKEDRFLTPKRLSDKMYDSIKMFALLHSIATVACTQPEPSLLAGNQYAVLATSLPTLRGQPREDPVLHCQTAAHYSHLLWSFRELRRVRGQRHARKYYTHSFPKSKSEGPLPSTVEKSRRKELGNSYRVCGALAAAVIKSPRRHALPHCRSFSRLYVRDLKIRLSQELSLFRRGLRYDWMDEGAGASRGWKRRGSALVAGRRAVKEGGTGRRGRKKVADP